MQSQLIHMARQMGAGGIWLPPTAGVCLDVSGHGRHAYGTGGGGVPLSIYTPQVRTPAWDGPASGTVHPYSNTLPADLVNTGEAHSLMALVYVPTTSESGAFVMLSDSSSRGLGIGIGASTFDDNGADIICLNEGKNWYDTGQNYTLGWNFVVYASEEAPTTSQWIYTNGFERWVGTNRATLSAGGQMGIRIGGYYNTSDRVFAGGVSITGWWPRKLSKEEIVALSAAARRERVAA